MTLLGLLELAVIVLVVGVLLAVALLAFGTAVAYAPDIARWVLRRLTGRHRPAPVSTDESPREAEGEAAPPKERMPWARVDASRASRAATGMSA